MNSYISLDLETTGLNPKLDKIIEIGAAKVIDGCVTDCFSSFVNPGRTLPEHVVSLTGISEVDLAGAPKAKDIIPLLIDFCEDLPLLGHRILFDYSFVKHEAVNLGIPFERSGIDTLKISRACLPDLPSKRLTDMCKYYDIPLVAHRAFNDAEATSLLFMALKKDFGKKYPKSFEPETLIFKIKRESPIRKQQKEKLEALISRYGIDCPYNLSMLTRNEASRYYDQIIAKHGK